MVNIIGCTDDFRNLPHLGSIKDATPFSRVAPVRTIPIAKDELAIAQSNLSTPSQVTDPRKGLLQGEAESGTIT